MTHIDKEKIRYWRGESLGYKAIAAKTGLSENAVKGFCKRNGLDGKPVPDTVCRQCEKPLTPAPRKKFCGDVCRRAWWNAHAYLREEHSRACAHCGAAFFSDPGKARKFCGHACYVAQRWGGQSS